MFVGVPYWADIKPNGLASQRPSGPVIPHASDPFGSKVESAQTDDVFRSGGFAKFKMEFSGKRGESGSRFGHDRFAKAVADAADGLDRVGAGAQFLPQRPNVDVDGSLQYQGISTKCRVD